jgi:hypothetical protein
MTGQVVHRCTCQVVSGGALVNSGHCPIHPPPPEPRCAAIINYAGATLQCERFARHDSFHLASTGDRHGVVRWETTLT